MINYRICPIHAQDLIGICSECLSGQPLAVCQKCINDKSSSHRLHTHVGIDSVKLIFNSVKDENPNQVNPYSSLYNQFEEFFDQLKQKLEDNWKNLKLEYRNKLKSIFDLVMVLDKFQQDQMYQIFLDPSLSFALREVVRQKKFTELDQQQLTDFANSKALIDKELSDAFARAREIIATGQPPKNINAQPCKNCPALKQEITGLNQQVHILKQQIEKINAANQQHQNDSQQAKRKIDELGAKLKLVNNEKQVYLNEKQELQANFQQANRKIDELEAQLKQVNNQKQNWFSEKQELQANIQNFNQKGNQLNEEPKKKPVLSNPVKPTNNKQEIMEKSLDTLDKSDKDYGKLVAKWSQVFDKLIKKGKTGFCGQKTDHYYWSGSSGLWGWGWSGTGGYCGTSYGLKAELNCSSSFYCCKECWKLGEGDTNK